MTAIEKGFISYGLLVEWCSELGVDPGQMQLAALVDYLNGDAVVIIRDGENGPVAYTHQILKEKMNTYRIWEWWPDVREH